MPNQSISHYILPTAATMAGVCMTVISIVKLTEATRAFSTLVDDALAFDNLLFLASCILSYASIRSIDRAERLERWADLIFLAAMSVMVAIGFMLAYHLGGWSGPGAN
jgi:hypothetical protein